MSPVGDNFQLHLERMEPDFIQSGEMTFQVTGRPFAQAEDVTSAPYPFDPDTRKIDLREQRRELRLIFTSNTQGGDYQLGRVLLHANVGDVRPQYGVAARIRPSVSHMGLLDEPDVRGVCGATAINEYSRRGVERVGGWIKSHRHLCERGDTRPLHLRELA